MYSEMWRALTKDGIESYLKHLGSQSRRQLADHLNSDRKRKKFEQRNSRTGRYVKYVIHRKRLGCVIYTTAKEAKEKAARHFSYHWLHDSKNGGWHRVNVTSEGQLDSLMRWPKFQSRLYEKFIRKSGDAVKGEHQ
jgi:Cft2 family RNA processing exonuclease